MDTRSNLQFQVTHNNKLYILHAEAGVTTGDMITALLEFQYQFYAMTKVAEAKKTPELPKEEAKANTGFPGSTEYHLGQPQPKESEPADIGYEGTI